MVRADLETVRDAPLLEVRRARLGREVDGKLEALTAARGNLVVDRREALVLLMDELACLHGPVRHGLHQLTEHRNATERPIPSSFFACS